MKMATPSIQSTRPAACVVPRPAREMSRRGLLWLAGTYALLFGAAALHHVLG